MSEKYSSSMNAFRNNIIVVASLSQKSACLPPNSTYLTKVYFSHTVLHFTFLIIIAQSLDLFSLFRVFRILPQLQLLDGIPMLDSDSEDGVYSARTCVIS